MDELQAVLFSAVGAFVLCSALLDLDMWTRTWTVLAKGNQLWQVWSFLRVEQVVLLALKCIAGLWLLVGAKGLRGAIRGLRRLGD